MSLERMRAFNTENRAEKQPHLREGVKPIFTTIEDTDRTSRSSREEVLELIGKVNISVLDFYALDKTKRERSLLSAGKNTYVISPIDASTKFSEDYYNCQGLVASGIDSDGNEISFMTHHNPAIFKDEGFFNEFKADLRGSLRAINNKVQYGTLDVVMFGGDAHGDKNADSVIDPELNRNDDYRIVAKTVAEIVKEEVGIETRIVEGPRIKPTELGAKRGNEQIGIYDTKNRHLHVFVRGAAENSGKTFAASEIDANADELVIKAAQYNKPKVE